MPADLPAPVILPAPVLVGPDARPVPSVPTVQPPAPPVYPWVVEYKPEAPRGYWVRQCVSGVCRLVFVRQ